MSNYPPYQFQPYQPPMGPYMQSQPFPNRMDMQPSNVPQPVQQSPQAQQGAVMGLSNASRPVTNREEAISTPADFSGALMVFPDLSNNRIYLKRWNMQTGSADFGEFAPVVPASVETKPEPAVAFASLQELQDLQGTVEDLKREIERLRKPAGKTVKKNDASDE